MTTILLVRHGQASFPANTIAGRLPGVALSNLGRMQVHELAQQLDTVPIRAVYASPLQRTQETADILAERLQLPSAMTDDNFNELDYGAWTGRTYGELHADPAWDLFNRFRSLAKIPDGESMLEVELRVIAGIGRLCQQHPGQLVVVVSHADVIRTILARCIGLSLDLAGRLEISNASMSVVGIEQNEYRVLTINTTNLVRLPID